MIEFVRVPCVVSRVAVLLAFTVGAAAPAIAGQSLADLTKKEGERRQTANDASRSGAAKVYTNEDLRAVPQTSTPVTPAAASESSSTTAAQAAASASTPSTAAAPDPPAPVRDQAYWSGRVKELRTQLERDETYVEALQSRVNALNTDFVNRDDPAQRSVVERDRQRALAELDRLKLQVENERKAIADFEEEARRASVPPGWLR